MTETVVVDACVFLGYALQDYAAKHPRQQAYADSVALAQARGDLIIAVPSIALAEIAKGLALGLEKGKINREQYQLLGTQLLDQAIDQIASPPSSIAQYTALKLQYQCQTYDALYLHLAKMRGFPLATLDADLARCALAAGVMLWQAHSL